MKVLQLWQPWASLVAIEAKKMETRHYPAYDWLIGQRVALHACKKKVHPLVKTEPFARRLQQADETGTLLRVGGLLPRGFIIATCVIKRTAPMTVEGIRKLEMEDPDERAFGFFGADRHAWVITNVERLAVPVPYEGRQGFPDIDDRLLVLEATAR